MKYFLDSGKIDEIEEAYDQYGIDGVTTNPNHIMKSGQPFMTVVKQVASFIQSNGLEGIDKFPVSFEINPHLNKAEDMVKAAKMVASYSDNYVIKIPCCDQGVIAAKKLEKQGIRTNVTLVFSPSQAIQAARIGAKFVSPFLGWKENSGDDACTYVKQIKQIYDAYGYKTEIIAAAVRNGYQIGQMASVGVDIVTAGLQVYRDSFYHPFTDYGLKKFQNAWDHTEGN
jgi:transaldolase